MAGLGGELCTEVLQLMVAEASPQGGTLYRVLYLYLYLYQLVEDMTEIMLVAGYIETTSRNDNTCTVRYQAPPLIWRLFA
jgi:hypothetical protein